MLSLQDCKYSNVWANIRSARHCQINKVKTGKGHIKLIAKTLIASAFLFVLSASPLKAQWNTEILELRGRIALQDGKYSNAIEHFNILSHIDSTSYWTYFYRGIAKYNLGDYRGAKNDFDHSVRINPLFTNGYHYRAITESSLGEYDDALNDLQKAIELRPGYNGLYFSRGVNYFLSQSFELAVEDFDRYIRHDAEDPSAYLNRGASYLFLGDTLKALNDYNKAIKLDRYESEGYVRRARLYASQGNYELAIKDMDQAISLDRNNTFAYFNRALMRFETKDLNGAMDDLNTVLRYEPGNALTLYNRSLIKMQVGDFEGAIDDMDRVLSINPRNVLAYFNRAACFIETGRLRNALNDYSRAIELYPDFAKAYQNRSYVESRLGMNEQSKADYETAQRKIRDYQSGKESGAFADTTRKYSSLLALDAEFARHDFDDELLQRRDIDVRLKPLFRIGTASSQPDKNRPEALTGNYESPALKTFLKGQLIPMEMDTHYGDNPVSVSLAGYGESRQDVRFAKAIKEIGNKQYTAALSDYNTLVESSEGETKALYLNNRAVLKAEMIDFMASIGSNVQTLTMDDEGTAKARVSDRIERNYDYSDAIDDMTLAAELYPELAYIDYNLGNLNCLQGSAVQALSHYDSAIAKHPDFGEAYYNRALVLIFLKDKEKGCIDLSKAGELGVGEAYSVIGKYCKKENE